MPPEGEGADAEREASPEPREPEPPAAPDSRDETPDAVAQPVANGTLSRRAAEAAAAAAAAAAAPEADEGEVSRLVQRRCIKHSMPRICHVRSLV